MFIFCHFSPLFSSWLTRSPMQLGTTAAGRTNARHTTLKLVGQFTVKHFSDFQASVRLNYLFSLSLPKWHGVWKSQKKSHSTWRAKRATFTFWVDKSLLKMPKMVNFGKFLKSWSLRSYSVTRQVIFIRTKIGENAKIRNENEKFWMNKSLSKMVNFGKFLKTWSLRSNSVTRQVTFNRPQISGKCQN